MPMYTDINLANLEWMRLFLTFGECVFFDPIAVISLTGWVALVIYSIYDLSKYGRDGDDDDDDIKKELRRQRRKEILVAIAAGAVTALSFYALVKGIPGITIPADTGTGTGTGTGVVTGVGAGVVTGVGAGVGAGVGTGVDVNVGVGVGVEVANNIPTVAVDNRITLEQMYAQDILNSINGVDPDISQTFINGIEWDNLEQYTDGQLDTIAQAIDYELVVVPDTVYDRIIQLHGRNR